MKLAVAYLYTITRYGYPPSADGDLEAMRHLARLGFHNIELEGLFRDHLLAVHKDRKARRRLADELGLHIYNFCPVVPECFAMDPRVRGEGFDLFARGVECAVEFGCETLHIATFHPPVTFRGPSPYSGSMNFATAYQVQVDPAFRFADYWQVVVESVRRSAEMAHAAGMRLIVEPRVGEVISHTDSLLRLIDWVDHPACNANLDLAHLHAQKELLPIAVEKLAGRIAGVHAADNDSRENLHLPPGEGTVDFEGTFRALVKHGYDGYVGIDVGGAGIADMDAALAQSRRYLEQLANRVGFPLES